MILGLHPAVFFSFLVWPIVYIVIVIIMYFVMASHDRKEEAWEKAYDEWEASTGYHNPLDVSKEIEAKNAAEREKAMAAKNANADKGGEN